MIALIAVFVILVQALFPASAMAARSDPGGAQVICTDHGLATVTLDGGKAPTQKHTCDHCICVGTVLPPALAPSVGVLVVRYAVSTDPATPIVGLVPGRGLAAPPPPPTGPPSII